VAAGAEVESVVLGACPAGAAVGAQAAINWALTAPSPATAMPFRKLRRLIDCRIAVHPP
jgi:hypothetical protein